MVTIVISNDSLYEVFTGLGFYNLTLLNLLLKKEEFQISKLKKIKQDFEKDNYKDFKNWIIPNELLESKSFVKLPPGGLHLPVRAGYWAEGKAWFKRPGQA